MVDALLTIEQGNALTAWVSQSGRVLRDILVTHGANWFGDGFDHHARLPVPAPSNDLQIDGERVQWFNVGPADGMLGSVVHVPASRTLCAGDIVYNNVHMWLWNSTPRSRQAWLASIDTVADVGARTIIAGHRDPAAPDDDAERQITQSRRYIQDFDEAVNTSTSATEVIEHMLARYPDFGNPYTLIAAATSQFS